MDAKRNPGLMFSLLFLSLSVNNHLSLGADTISANQSLSGDQTIVSGGGSFVLGFFTPGNSSKYYIGVWYSQVKVSTQTIVWVANRDKPVSDKSSSVLRISDGNLVLFNESQIPVWSTNLSSTTSSAVAAVLRDEGNLVLRDGSSSNLSEPLWQSFDHPTHTWLPGGKIGLNKITKENQRLISWKNSEDPAPGLFSFELDANISSYIIRWNRSIQYWTSGPWDGNIFSLLPEVRSNNIYNLSYIDDTNQSYFTYYVYNPSILTRLVIDVSGQIKQSSWVLNTNQWFVFLTRPKTQCEVYAFCGAFVSCDQISQPFCKCLKGFGYKSPKDWNLSDYSGGCVRKTPLQCENTSPANGQKDKFLTMPNMNLPVQAQFFGVGTVAECESSCLNNCSCTAYSYDANNCSIWIGELFNLKQLTEDEIGARTLYLRLAASEFSSHENNKGVVGAVVGSVAGVALLLGLIVFVILRRRKRAVGTAKSVEGSLMAFEYRDLRNATKDFSDKLGGGGFGSVFRGTLPDSTAIAVKKLESISQGEKQFRTEVSTIGTIQHVNLVRLRGFCSDGSRKLLVYDYMPNGSLESQLFHEKNPNQVLDWKTRYQIALGTARGLVYLHEKCRECIIHCDIKPENILLDEEFCPKVADFGLAKLVGREFSRVLTTIRGTRGYLAPEWISGVAITAKADVYSYGMMLFEFVSGRRNSEPSADGKTRFFPTWAASIMKEGGDVLGLLDPRLEENADVEELTRVCRIACWCIQDDEANRPPMSQVVQILEGVLEVNPAPIPRSLQVVDDDRENIIFFTESSSNQSSQARSNTSAASSQSKSDGQQQVRRPEEQDKSPSTKLVYDGRP